MRARATLTVAVNAFEARNPSASAEWFAHVNPKELADRFMDSGLLCARFYDDRLLVAYAAYVCRSSAHASGITFTRLRSRRCVRSARF